MSKPLHGRAKAFIGAAFIFAALIAATGMDRDEDALNILAQGIAIPVAKAA